MFKKCAEPCSSVIIPSRFALLCSYTQLDCGRQRSHNF
uniref:Uncharacterized protein n=1 Tax=Anguilla anguilla TaxID=7936 RepID=A0A0E9V2B2_ANGAN